MHRRNRAGIRTQRITQRHGHRACAPVLYMFYLKQRCAKRPMKGLKGTIIYQGLLQSYFWLCIVCLAEPPGTVGCACLLHCLVLFNSSCAHCGCRYFGACWDRLNEGQYWECVLLDHICNFLMVDLFFLILLLKHQTEWGRQKQPARAASSEGLLVEETRF